MDSLRITQDCLWIAFGFALGLADDGDCQGVAYGLTTWCFGIVKDSLGIAKSVPDYDLGIGKGLP